MRPPVYLGIDPGVSGGIALVGETSAEAWKLQGMTPADHVALLRQLQEERDIRMTLIEKLWVMPKAMRGTSAAFTLGKSYGMLLGMLWMAEFRFEEMAPGVWQRTMGCLTPGVSGTKKKRRHKERAQQLFPGIKVINATADALLIAECCKT